MVFLYLNLLFFHNISACVFLRLNWLFFGTTSILDQCRIHIFFGQLSARILSYIRLQLNIDSFNSNLSQILIFDHRFRRFLRRILFTDVLEL